ncbi:MAG: hypothetical protein WA691_05840 [Thermoplasmata archaeon]
MSTETSRLVVGYPAATSTREAAGIITGLAILALVLTVLFAAVAQVGVRDCVVCAGNYCMGTDSPSCPETAFAVVTTGAVLAVESFFVSVGLSFRAFASAYWRQPDDSDTGVPTGRQLALHLAAPSLMFLGWALVFLGLLLPFGLFQFCHEACGYPYFPWVLTGYALLMVVLGAVILGTGVALLTVVAVQLKRSTHRRASGDRTDPRGQDGPS